MKIDDVIQTSLLYDFYGSLLTDRQREVMELYYGRKSVTVRDRSGVFHQQTGRA